MPITKIALTPGVNREGTSYSNENGYYACDKVRFKSGFPESIGGWVPYSFSTFLGRASDLLTYSCTCGVVLTGVGTNLKYYVERGSAYYDVTPVRDTVNVAANAFSTDTATPTIIICNVTNHGAVDGDFVTISGVAAPVNGVPVSELNGEHRVTVIDPSSFYIAVTTAPSSTGTAGAATFEFQINTGLAAYAVPGWGAGGWGASLWGTGAPTPGLFNLRLWSAANYGDDIVFGPRGGGLYYWAFDSGAGLTARGVAIKDMVGANQVPLFQNQVLVSDQRITVTIGANDYLSTEQSPMLVRWSDQENYLEWEPTALTQAGSQILTAGSELVCMLKARQEILIWSDSALYSMQFLGPPLVYGFNILADSISIAGPNASVVVNNTVYWMGKDKFYSYNGTVMTLPSSIRSFVFNDVNFDALRSVVAGSNEAFNEVWWFYTSNGSSLNDRYVVYNYMENAWYYGNLSRTAWLDSGMRGNPIAATYDANTEVGQLYYHEVGCDDGETNPPSPIQAFIETSDFDIDDGHNFAFVTRIIPDLTFEGSTANNPSVTLSVKPRRFSGSNYGTADSPGVTRASTVPVEQYTEQVFVRLRGRQMAMRVDSNSLGTKWRMGAMRMSVQPDGRK